MHLKFRNVNDAFKGLVEGMFKGSIPVVETASRNGPVLMVEEPVIVTYDRPTERVLFNRERDANCFFHLYESLWMLAGRNDIAPLTYYVKQYAEYSDDGVTANGAYGYRWRNVVINHRDAYQHVDQLGIIIDHLRRKPESRRVVLQMWDVENDLLKIDTSKDVCCNLSVMFSVETGMCRNCDGQGRFLANDEGGITEECPVCHGKPHDQPRYLNMTVTNRSNDMIWGMLGANVVHFSFLQEYVACALGLDVGRYHQFTTNLHVYTQGNSGWHPEQWLGEYSRDMHSTPPYERMYELPQFETVPLVKNRETFDKEVAEFVERHGKDAMAGQYSEPFLRLVAQPMCIAFHHHKNRDYHAARASIENVVADDWRVAGKQWLAKRHQQWEAKNAG